MSHLKSDTRVTHPPRLEITPPQIVGPFYPVSELPDSAVDLTRPTGSAAAARGELICVSGRVFAASGVPVAHARIEIWQANAAGKYRHPSDRTQRRLIPISKASRASPRMRLGTTNFKQSNQAGIRRLKAKSGRLTFISQSMVGLTDWSPSFISLVNQ